MAETVEVVDISGFEPFSESGLEDAASRPDLKFVEREGAGEDEIA